MTGKMTLHFPTCRRKHRRHPQTGVSGGRGGRNTGYGTAAEMEMATGAIMDGGSLTTTATLQV